MNYTEEAEVRRWLEAQAEDPAKRGNVTVFAARCALRAMPGLGVLTNLDDWPDFPKNIVLAVFRATVAPWVGAMFPTHGATIATRAASAATRAAASAAHASDAAATDAARTAAYAATAASAAGPAEAAAAAGGAAARVAARATAASASASDIDAMNLGLSPEQLAATPLWPESAPISKALDRLWARLKTALEWLEEDWDVWTTWYQARLDGQPTYPHLTAAENEAIEVARVTELTEADWLQGPAHVNARIREIEARFGGLEGGQEGLPGIPEIETEPADDESPPALDREIPVVGGLDDVVGRLAEVASPDVAQTADGQLDAVANSKYDTPDPGDPSTGQRPEDLAELPFRQIALIQTILSDLPANAPKHLRTAMAQYGAELEARRAKPMLGLLRDQEGVIFAAVKSERAAKEWMEEGHLAGFRSFRRNHRDIVKYFPLDAERDAVFDAIPIDEVAATGDALIGPVRQVREAVDAAHEAGAVNEAFKTTNDQLADHIAAVANELPPSSSLGDLEFGVGDDDRISPPISAKKRAILTQTAYLAKAYTIANAINTPPMEALSAAIALFLRQIAKLLG